MPYNKKSLIKHRFRNLTSLTKGQLERVIYYFDGAGLFVVATGESNVNGVRRQKFSRAFGPFNDGDAAGFKIFIEPEVVGLFRPAKAVQVDVMKRDRSLIFADERIGRATNRLGDAGGLREALREAGFARAEVSVQSNHDRGGKAPGLLFFQCLEKFRCDFPSIGRTVRNPFHKTEGFIDPPD